MAAYSVTRNRRNGCTCIYKGCKRPTRDSFEATRRSTLKWRSPARTTAMMMTAVRCSIASQPRRPISTAAAAARRPPPCCLSRRVATVPAAATDRSAELQEKEEASAVVFPFSLPEETRDPVKEVRPCRLRLPSLAVQLEVLGSPWSLPHCPSLPFLPSFLSFCCAPTAGLAQVPPHRV